MIIEDETLYDFCLSKKKFQFKCDLECCRASSELNKCGKIYFPGDQVSRDIQFFWSMKMVDTFTHYHHFDSNGASELSVNKIFIHRIT